MTEQQANVIASETARIRRRLQRRGVDLPANWTREMFRRAVARLEAHPSPPRDAPSGGEVRADDDGPAPSAEDLAPDGREWWRVIAERRREEENARAQLEEYRDRYGVGTTGGE